MAVPRTVLLANPGADLYGSDRMLLESVRALVRAGHRVYVTVPERGPLVELVRDAGAVALTQPTPILRKSAMSIAGLVRLGVGAFSSWGSTWRLIRQVDPATVLVNTITEPLWLLLGRLAGRRVVCHVHEAERSIPPGIRRLIYLPLTLCHSIVVNSATSLDVVKEVAPRLGRRAHIVHNAVAGPDVMVPARVDLTGPVRVLYVGRLSRRKGPHVAIEATRLLLEHGRWVHLTLIGAVFPGNEAYEEELQRLVRQWGLEDHVTWLGFQSRVWSHIAECDIMVVPSTGDESFGNTSVEALLAARPVIISDAAGLREATAMAKACLETAGGDAHALACAVLEIIDRWHYFRKHAKEDSRRLGQHFSRENYSRNLLTAMQLC